MGLLGRLTGWDQFGAQQNAVLATHLLDTAPAELRRQIATRVVNHMIEIYCGGSTAEEVLDKLNSLPRGVQMQFIADACIDLGIPPNIKNHTFNYVKNPFRTRDWVSDKEIGYTVLSTKRLIAAHPELYAASGTIGWPGNDVKVDFTTLRQWV